MLWKMLMALGRKALSLALIFNFVVSLISSLSILCGWCQGICEDLYKPYVDISFFWFVALTSILNIVPARMLGKVNIRRILFHHYVYGFLSILAYIFLSALFSMLRASTLFHWIQDSQPFMILLLYWGITLIIDDITDVSPRMLRLFNYVKKKMRRVGKLIVKAHLISSFISIYIAVCMLLWCFENAFLAGGYPPLDPVRILLILNLFITALYGLKAAGKGVWLKYF